MAYQTTTSASARVDMPFFWNFLIYIMGFRCAHRSRLLPIGCSGLSYKRDSGSCTSSLRVIPAAQKPVKMPPSTICVRGLCHGIQPRFLPTRADRCGVVVSDALWAMAIGAYGSAPADTQAADAAAQTLQRGQTL